MDWQTYVSLLIVAGCVLVGAVKLYRSLTVPTTGCGSCSSCPANKAGHQGSQADAGQSITLVQIDD